MDNAEYLKAMGAKIRAARRAKKLLQRDIGEGAGIHRKSMTKIERGEKNVHLLTLKGIADTLGMDVKEFL